jgi:hypothetical protein
MDFRDAGALKVVTTARERGWLTPELAVLEKQHRATSLGDEAEPVRVAQKIRATCATARQARAAPGLLRPARLTFSQAHPLARRLSCSHRCTQAHHHLPRQSGVRKDGGCE